MANLLLLDDSEVAGLAMRGIAGRSRHRCVVAPTPEEAWRLLRELVIIDLVIVELRLQGGDGGSFISQLRGDPVFKNMPVVVYTALEDHSRAVKLRPLKIQNYLIKPYSEEVLHEEIQRAQTSPWRNLHFEEERSFCAQMGLTSEGLREMRQAICTQLTTLSPQLQEAVQARNTATLTEHFTTLQDAAQQAGFWGLSDKLDELLASARNQNFTSLAGVGDQFDFLARLLSSHLNPTHVPENLISDAERKEKEEEKDRVRWVEADVDTNGPVVPPESPGALVDALPACPVIDTIAAEFQMAAQAKSPTLRHLMDLVTKDPALSTQVLIAANSLERDDPSPVEDPGVAVALLGNLRLSTMASNMPLVEERYMHLPPITWSQFWLFQMAVADVSLFTCKQLEFEVIQPHIFTAGLLHDIGKLLLVRIYPHGFRAMVDYAKARAIPLHEAEIKYMGCTSRDLAVRFCATHHVPPRYAHVIQWVESPQTAAEDLESVAVVSLARTLCLHNHVGYCGDTPKDTCPPIEETPAWEVLQSRIYPSFNLKRFENQVHEHCRHLKKELLGRAR